MDKIYKEKLILGLLLTILSISCIYASSTPNAQAAEISNKDKGLMTLNIAMGLNFSEYSVTAKEIPASDKALNLGVLPQEDIQYDLISGDNVLKVLSTFVNGKLQMLYVVENRGVPNKIISDASTNMVDLAVDFLKRYDFINKFQDRSADSLYRGLTASFENLDASKNLTKTIGSTQLKVTVIDDCTTFKWTYISNDAIAPSKIVALSFEKGFLKYFVDKWDYYCIGNNNITFSKEKSIDIALQTARAYNWSANVDADSLAARNFNESNVRWTSLLFDDSLKIDIARNEDLLTLYPVWRVGIALDKWYGQLYGIQVDVWADSGEVRCVQEAWSTLPATEKIMAANMSSTESNYMIENLMLIGLPTVLLVGLGVLIIVIRNKASYLYRVKPCLLKTSGIMLCLLVASTVGFSAIESVAASRASIVWGSESTGAGAYPYSWRKHATEVELQQAEAIAINSFFSSNGYTSVNRQGNLGSTKSQILSDFSYYQSNYDYLAVVDFDHGVGGSPGYPTILAPPGEFHYMFEDNEGTKWGTQQNPSPHPEHGVYDLEINQRLTHATISFALINTCLSANTDMGNGMKYGGGFPGRAQGMPYAFTNRQVLSRSDPNFNVQYHISNDGYNNPDNGPQVYMGFPAGSASLMEHLPYDYGTYRYYEWVNWFFDSALFYDISVNQALNYATTTMWPGEGYTFGNCPLQDFTAYWWNANPETQQHCRLAVFGNGNIFLRYYEPHHVGTPIVSGPTTGYVNTAYQFNAYSVDSCGHNVRYTFDWNDGTSYTTGWYYSGQIAATSHSWSSERVYEVKVRAECSDGALSGWSSAHIMNIGDFPLLTLGSGAYYQGQGLVGIPLWIDDNYVGTTPYYGYVSPTTHQIYIYPDLYIYQFMFFEYDGILDWNDPTSISITSDKTIMAWYSG